MNQLEHCHIAIQELMHIFVNYMSKSVVMKQSKNKRIELCNTVLKASSLIHLLNKGY